ncbi:MAG: Crp/Fnr family transcriptional regulator [Nitratireductor sp.]|nr:Crp/Fnr family transcriptional regulator [Nitratireductor sp.]
MSLTTQKLFCALASEPLRGMDNLMKRVVLRSYRAGATIFAAGDRLHDLRIVRSGLLKLCYVLPSGDEWIKSLMAEGAFFSSIAALQPAGEASFDAVAIEACEIECLPFAPLMDLARADVAWAGLVNELLLAYATRKELRERDLLTLKPEARYRRFAETEPQMVGRVAQKDLAAYLGVTPVGLNRIIRRVEGKR